MTGKLWSKRRIYNCQAARDVVVVVVAASNAVREWRTQRCCAKSAARQAGRPAPWGESNKCPTSAGRRLALENCLHQRASAGFSALSKRPRGTEASFQLLVGLNQCRPPKLRGMPRGAFRTALVHSVLCLVFVAPIFCETCIESDDRSWAVPPCRRRDRPRRTITAATGGSGGMLFRAEGRALVRRDSRQRSQPMMRNSKKFHANTDLTSIYIGFG